MIDKEITDVLVVLTGGTFALNKSESGYIIKQGLCNRLKKISYFYDEDKALELGLRDDQLITSETPYKKRIRYNILEFEDLIESNNITI